MKNDFKIISFIFLIVGLCTVMYFNKDETISHDRPQKKQEIIKKEKKQPKVVRNKVSNKKKQTKKLRTPAQITSPTTTTRAIDPSDQSVFMTPTLDEQKIKYDLDEVNKISLLEINFYLSKNSKVFRGKLEDFDRSLGKVVSARQGYIEYKQTGNSKFAQSNDFPVVINEDNAQVGYLSGEVVLSLSNYKKHIDGVRIEREDKNRNLIYLETSNLDQINLLVKEYGKDPFFYIYVNYGENKPI